MIEWYLVLYTVSGSTISTIPQPYVNKTSCEDAAKDWSDDYTINRKHVCIKVQTNVKDKGYVCKPDENICQVVK